MKCVVIVGGGFAGAYCAKALEKQLKGDGCEVYLIDRNNYLVFYPLLIEAGTGSIEPRHAVVAIRTFLNRTHFHTGEALEIDTDRKTLLYEVTGMGTRTIQYDHLVVALGSITRMLDIPGLQNWAFEIKSLTDAIALRDRAIQMLELAESAEDDEQRRELLHFVVVGANFTGVEVAGEFQHFLQNASRFYRKVRPEHCRVTLVEITGRILSALDESLSAYAVQHLRKLGVNILLKTSVEQVEEHAVHLSGDRTLASRTLIWCAGVAPNPLLRRLPFPVDRNGYVLCERDLRVRGYQDVWAIGDCAVNLDPQGKPYPATAQHAVQQAKVLARNICRALEGKPTENCDISSRGSMAALGARRGVALVYGRRISGFLAWFIYRSYYLWAMPGWARKMRISFDWALDLLFSRDYVQLGVHTAPPKRRLRQAAD